MIHVPTCFSLPSWHLTSLDNSPRCNCKVEGFATGPVESFPTLQIGRKKKPQKGICTQGGLQRLLVNQVYVVFGFPIPRREMDWEMGHMICMFANRALSAVSTKVISCNQPGLWLRGCCEREIPELTRATPPAPLALLYSRVQLAWCSPADGHETHPARKTVCASC